MNEKLIVFVGQPNTGKSSWINQLCGSKYTTGNWSGVTVEKNEAFLQYENVLFHMIDLPGIQGFHHESDEERITESFLKNETIDCIVQVLDSCHMEASLFLTMELRKFQIPMVCLLNFEDEARKYGIHINTGKLSQRLSIPVILCSSFSKEKNKLILECFKNQSNSDVIYRPLLNPSADILLEDLLRWYPLKEAIVKFDEQYTEISLQEKVNAVKSCMKFVEGDISKNNMQSLRLDHFLLCNPLGKCLILMLFMFCFLLSFLIGNQISELFQYCISYLEFFFVHNLSTYFPDFLVTFISDVLLNGIGSLISFLPQLFFFYLMISFLEECGIMSRLSLLMDGWMRYFHLTGKAFITLFLAHGCNVPAILHSTSLENERMRRKTALLVPFCSCSARLPVYFMILHALFGNRGVLGCLILVATGIFTVLLLSCLFEMTGLKGELSQQIIELTPYRFQTMKLALKKTGHQMKHYLIKIIKVLFLSLSVVWGLMNFPEPGSHSFLVGLSKRISVLFRPLGFGENWIYTASLMTGLIAKEAVAGTMVMLMEMTNASLIDNLAVNFSYLVFVGLSVPCVMTCAAIKNKYGFRWMMVSIAFSLIVSYLMSFIVLQFLMFF